MGGGCGERGRRSFMCEFSISKVVGFVLFVYI